VNLFSLSSIGRLILEKVTTALVFFLIGLWIGEESARKSKG
jgi:hypothetical protein